jgi:membrane-bound lytic murein transglycosylase F
MSKIKRLVSVGILSFTTLAMNGCDAIYWNESTSLAKAQESTQNEKEIRVLTLKNPLTYSTDRAGHKFGIDYDLLENFGTHYNFKIRFIPVSSELEMKQALTDGKAEIAAARIATPDKDQEFLVGPAYEETFLTLFCRRQAQVANVQDLNDKKIGVLAKNATWSFYQNLLSRAPQANIYTRQGPTAQGLFRELGSKNLDCVVAENLEGQLYARYYASVEKVTAISGNYSLSWLVRPDLPDLNRLLQAWFQKASREDEIMRVHDRYKLYLSELDRNDVIRFMKQSRRVLPELAADFKHAAREHDVPWQLIAAVCYQESQWDNEAVSYTGVRGLMQLTRSTADHLGVDDRTDPLQSIWGGAKYLRYLLNKTPRHLNFKDRMALALTAYNIGFAHLRDAQKLAERQGKNPNSWRHLREVLPLLENPAYEDQLEYGSARGTEAVDFVERTAGFYNLMVAIQP